MNKLSFLLVLALTILTNEYLVAQGEYEATPYNTNSIANQIYNDHADDINISVAQIEAHLLNLTQAATYDPIETNTSLEVEDMSGDDINVEWDPESDTPIYRVAYLNLSDGSTELDQTQNEDWSWSGMDGNTYYLAAITTFKTDKDGGTTSTYSSIIIIEKTVFYPGEEAENCNCENSTILYNFQSETGVSDLITQFTPQVNKQHVLSIEYTDGTPPAYVMFKVKKVVVDGEILYAIKPWCFGNVWLTSMEFPEGQPNTFWGYNEDNPLTIIMGTFDFTWALTHPNPIIKTVQIKACDYPSPNPGGLGDTRNREKIGELVNNEIYPNPASDYLMLNLENEIFLNDEMISLEIFNQTGKKMLSLDQLETENSIDISSIPNGHYFLRIRNSKNQEVHQFVKME